MNHERPRHFFHPSLLSFHPFSHSSLPLNACLPICLSDLFSSSPLSGLSRGVLINDDNASRCLSTVTSLLLFAPFVDGIMENGSVTVISLSKSNDEFQRRPLANASAIYIHTAARDERSNTERGKWRTRRERNEHEKSARRHFKPRL